ncbi:meiosis-specific cyclin Rem1 [Clonorchis sinensis]|uniref:GTP-binding protein REM 1 n=2 Tax=Clonorchis sinensis TaxID=79923 RepID=G7YB35_CLOSI|nr:meiosis-specific cyclin Rem1 [Clonorchis sinensis]GAA50169.1 GTP-binding protein REM 1 [Clonorchis sinensis]
MNIDDDFERFCQIAQRSPRTSLSPTEHYTDGRAQRGEYLGYPEDGQVKRSSSFREPRGYVNMPRERSREDISGARSPVSSGRQMPYPLERRNIGDFQRSSISHQRIPREFVDKQNGTEAADMYDEYNAETPYQHPQAFHQGEGRHQRNRAGSMKETGQKHPNKVGYRPSAPTLYTSTLSPTYAIDPHSPSRLSSNSAEDNVIRVRRFQRKKSGQLIRKGDQNLPQPDVYRAPEMYQNVGRSVRPGTINYPTICTDEVSDRSDLSLSDSEVVEVPAITTTLVNPAEFDQTGPVPLRPPSSGLPSPNALRPEFRNRSRSWAFVSQPSPGSPASYSSPSDSFPSNEILTVQVLGMGRVGKTSLCLQFQTSESLDVNLDRTEDEQTRALTVEVNNMKFNLELFDTNLMEDDFQANAASLIVESADAYVVVYAIDDRSSFLMARSIVSYLLGQCKRSSAILLAANKSDLVRTRAVSVEEGKNLAAVYNCPFYEISTSLNHRVDELLVGIVIAIQERRREVDKERDRLEKMAMNTKHGSLGATAHRSSLGAIKSQTNNVVKFFQKHFSKKDKRSNTLM